MSKAAKQSIIILIVLLLGSLGFALYSMLESQKAKDENLQLNAKLTQVQDRENKAKAEVKKLNEDLSKVNAEKDRLDEKVKKAEKTAEDLYGQITEISQDRDKWKSQIDAISKERDDLVSRAKDLQDQLAKKEEESRTRPSVPAPAPINTVSMESAIAQPSVDSSMPSPTSAPGGNEDYWASVLRDKAALEVKIEQFNQELTQKNTELVDLKQANADFKVKLEGLQHDKEAIEREIKYKSDLVNNLSLELARSKNDKKYVADTIVKLNEENANLRQQLKQLVATKGSLEKSILRLTQDRDTMQRKLGQTETLVQSKIDEIWNIKDSIDQNVKDSQAQMPKPSGVELPPIVVSNDANAVPFNSGMSNPGIDGKIVNFNKDNNFVIVNVGESQGIQVGNSLNVYRGNKYIGRLEVIQVRKDISAADVKDQSTELAVGDLVR